MGGDDGQQLQDAFAYHLARGRWPADGHVLTLSLDADPNAGATTRRALEEDLLGRADAEELELLKTLTSELVNNAVLHGSGSGSHVGVSVGTARQRFRVEVCDDGPGFEAPRPPRPRERGGMGLVIIDRVSTRWGSASNAGSCVWFELDR